ncbi:ig-like domain-containing protein [Caerostris darwini]|uniref:Ig-like domain-containing protein n=1 Tax=Caerostris darwini TaxID=1538125 RepID=A0AAV4WA37_9ARAC|nr:ig-like domain-containing protein [Caerostris darwini]
MGYTTGQSSETKCARKIDVSIPHSDDTCFSYKGMFLPKIPLSLEVGSNVTSAVVHSAVTLSCVAMSYPRATVSWSRASAPWPPGDALIKSDPLSHVRVLSTLTLGALRRQDNGTYYCAANNRQEMLMAQQDVVVLGEYHTLTIQRGLWSHILL